MLSALSYTGIYFGTKIINTSFISITNSYLISFVYAYLIFILALLLRDRIQLNSFFSFIANSSYSLYLLHGIIGGTIFQILSLFTRNQLVILPAIFFSIVAAWLSFRYIERPCINTARKITGYYTARHSME